MSSESVPPPLPLVTCVVPCHNHAVWVNEALTSLVTQDYQNKRIVFVDDGSTDGSCDAVLATLVELRLPPRQGEPWLAAGRVRGSDTNAMVVRFSEAHGPAFARNAGLKAGWEGTDVFALLDSDDLYEQGKISKSIAKFMEAPDQIGVVYSDYDTMTASGSRQRQYKEAFSRERLLHECLVNCDSLVTRTAFERCGLFDETLRVCEDYDLWLRISESLVLTHLPESLLTIRVGSHSSTATVKSDTWKQCYSRVFAKLEERMRNPK